MTHVLSINPATAYAVETGAEEHSPDQVAAICAAAASAVDGYNEGGRTMRAALLRAVGKALEARRDDIVDIGIRETALAAQRLNGELTRTIYQAKLFADVVEEGSFLEATIDHPADTNMGAGPDIRRMLVPIGPVAVFGASNFPLAFSVPGGDTVAALAAGCPVVIKAHSSHPALSLLTFDALQDAVAAVGAPESLIGLVFGFQAGLDLVNDPAITAVTFTGSLTGGRALMDAISQRPEPIPFFGEMSSLNPVIITAQAAQARGSDLAKALITSVTGSGGQLCTKPGVVFIPDDKAGDDLTAQAIQLLNDTAAQVLLNANIRTAYESAPTGNGTGLRVIAEGAAPTDSEHAVSPRLVEVDAAEARIEEIDECFGPMSILVRYRDGELGDLLDRLPGSLTGTIHAEPTERELTTQLAARLERKVGRILFAGFPTGVHVTWAQTHGGPWPSTNTQHTSVGTTSVRRFQRPVSWQSAPEWVLPPELRDDYVGIPRRIEGVLQPR